MRLFGVIIGICGIFVGYINVYLKYREASIFMFFQDLWGWQYFGAHCFAVMFLLYTIASYFGKRNLMVTIAFLVLFWLIFISTSNKCIPQGGVDLKFIFTIVAFMFPLVFKRVRKYSEEQIA